jgi:hypothetical protein
VGSRRRVYSSRARVVQLGLPPHTIRQLEPVQANTLSEGYLTEKNEVRGQGGITGKRHHSADGAVLLGL